jgi:hypothetical protein
MESTKAGSFNLRLQALRKYFVHVEDAISSPDYELKVITVPSKFRNAVELSAYLNKNQKLSKEQEMLLFPKERVLLGR